MAKVSIILCPYDERLGARGDTPIFSLRTRDEGSFLSGREPLHPDAHRMEPPS